MIQTIKVWAIRFANWARRAAHQAFILGQRFNPVAGNSMCCSLRGEPSSSSAQRLQFTFRSAQSPPLVRNAVIPQHAAGQSHGPALRPITNRHHQPKSLKTREAGHIL